MIKYAYFKDMVRDNNKEVVRYNDIRQTDTGIETVFNFSSRNGGCSDSFYFYNDYVVVNRRGA